MLDLSVAFDTVDHDILIERLKHRFGITGKALTWIKSYLCERTQFVKIGSKRSNNHKLCCGVPQGSVLGPILYSMYTAPLADVISKHGMNCHFYADDSQIYLSFKPNDPGEPMLSKARVEACIQDINQWMIANRLILNHEKFKLLILHARHRPPPTLDSVLVGSKTIHVSKSAKNIGTWFDTVMSMDNQISNICKCSFYHLRNIAKISKFISSRHCETLIHAFITSRIDHCNSLLSGLNQNQIKRLQHVQNLTTRLLTGTRKQEHITPVLKELHWLPVTARIRFKILLMTFKCLNLLAPRYLTDLLTAYKPSRSLRSSTKHLLVQPCCNLKTYGERAFSVAAPRLWNALPLNIRNCKTITTFKSALKTHLFKSYFEL